MLNSSNQLVNIFNECNNAHKIIIQNDCNENNNEDTDNNLINLQESYESYDVSESDSEKEFDEEEFINFLNEYEEEELDILSYDEHYSDNEIDSDVDEEFISFCEQMSKYKKYTNDELYAMFSDYKYDEMINEQKLIVTDDY